MYFILKFLHTSYLEMNFDCYIQFPIPAYLVVILAKS